MYAGDSESTTPEGLDWTAFHIIGNRLLITRNEILRLSTLSTEDYYKSSGLPLNPKMIFNRLKSVLKNQMICTSYESQSLIELLEIYKPTWKEIEEGLEKGDPHSVGFSGVHFGEIDVPEGGEKYWTAKFLSGIAKSAINLSHDLSTIVRSMMIFDNELIEIYQENQNIMNKFDLKNHVVITETGFKVSK